MRSAGVWKRLSKARKPVVWRTRQEAARAVRQSFRQAASAIGVISNEDETGEEGSDKRGDAPTSANAKDHTPKLTIPQP